MKLRTLHALKRVVVSTAPVWMSLHTMAIAQDYSVVVLPDTQYYSQDYPDIYTDQTRWVVNNIENYNIRFVSHLGDIVNQAATLGQWDNAFTSMSLLDDADMPYGTIGGNHDFLYPGDYYDPNGTNYLAYFGPDRYDDKPWFKGASPSGLSNYQIIEVSGEQFLFLHLVLETPAAELAWAQGVLNEHKNLPTWISTHRYLFDWSILGAGRYDDFNYTFEPLYRHDGIKSDDFFNNFVAANKQIYLVHCGHNHSEYRQSSVNNYGLTVHEVLADYQSGSNGGNGWLRICTLKPENNTIEVQTYSPTLDRWDTDADSKFTLNVDFDAYKSGADESIIQFQNGVNDYTGTIDTWINEAEKNSNYSSSSVLVADDDTENSWFSDNAGQSLIKYSEIIQPAIVEGDPEPTRIPVNAQVLSASLILTLKDDQDVGNATYRVYPMSRNWQANDTWNSLDNGVNTGAETLAQIASFSGDNKPDNNYGRTLDITDTVQSWVNSSLSNQGFAIIRDQTNGNDDGIELHSSETSDSTLRPKMAVRIKYPVKNVSPHISEALAASATEINEGEELTLSVSAADPNPLDPLVFMIDQQDVGFVTGKGDVQHYLLMEDEGYFSFTASVRDDEDEVAAGNVSVIVKNLPPVIVSITQNLTVKVNTPVNYTVSASDPGIYDVLSYAWDINDDGLFDDNQENNGTVTFSQPGSYVITVKVSDDDGGVSTEKFVVTVQA